MDKINGMDWTGLPKINYMCMNSYAVKADPEGKEFTDFKLIHKLSNQFMENFDQNKQSN